ncbi:MAG: exodeoxyribonuclease V subunit alpha, partial [Candidatus Competibacteraceae bacterium]|nr:exodeoxyribonuclease V subunit alpha [Candidatus Competibacteraceae bacterium]
PEQAATLHRLLGWRPGSGGLRHGPDHPLALDVLVVDEASMVDLALMTRLLGALPAGARLILLGDKDQLASVEAGAVLADICGPVPGFRQPFCRRLERLLDQPLAAGEGDRPLADCVVLLRHSYRFGADSGIGRLARRVNAGDGAGALGVLEEGFADLDWRSLELRDYPPRSLDKPVIEGFGAYLQLVAQGAEPQLIFRAFEDFRVLCALRQGPAGVNALNESIQSWLADQGLIRLRATVLSGWYPGRPVMITRNDYNLRLYNGDIGLCLETQGQLRVCFLTSQGELRHFPPARLPEHETVYAMTVHKSQGSEFGRVLLLLPPEPARIMTRELLYTGITRARDHLQLWGPEGVLRFAAGRRLHRSSGLGERLWGREGRD